MVVNAELIFWLVEEVGVPLAKNLYTTWTAEGKDPLVEIERLKNEGLTDWPDLKAGTPLQS